jgi:hypothetical protein
MTRHETREMTRERLAPKTRHASNEGVAPAAEQEVASS